MADLMDIHSRAQAEMRKRYQLMPVSLKHPFPERPLRALGLMKIDGEVFSTERLLRVVFIRPQLPTYFAVRSHFIRPRVEYDLPVFAGEVMQTGKKKMLIVDIHRAGKTHHDDSTIFDRMLTIRNRYPELTKYEKKQTGQVQEVFSPAACQVSFPADLDELAGGIYIEYLNLFCDVVNETKAKSGEELRKTQEVFDDYLKTLVDHDPGVRVWKALFGAKGGIERSLDMHFGM